MFVPGIFYFKLSRLFASQYGFIFFVFLCTLVVSYHHYHHHYIFFFSQSISVGSGMEGKKLCQLVLVGFICL